MIRGNGRRYRLISWLGLALLALAPAARAENLCAAQCEIDIAFPTGGSIIARAQTTFTFGDNGLIDTAGSVTGYVAGQTRTLNAGERLDFGNGGRFVLGDGGNVDLVELIVVTGGVARISAVGGSEALSVAPGRLLSVFGGADLIFKVVELSLQGGLQLGANGQLGLYNDVATGCGITAHATDAVRIGQVAITVNDNDACRQLLNAAAITVIDQVDYLGAPPAAPADDAESKDATALSPAMLAALLPLLGVSAARRWRRAAPPGADPRG